MERARGHAYIRKIGILLSRVCKNVDNFPYLLNLCTFMSQKSCTFAAEYFTYLCIYVYVRTARTHNTIRETNSKEGRNSK